MNIDLTAKRALVCGGSQGIGLAVAQELAEMGASLTLMSRSEDKLKAAIGQLSNPERHDYLVADFSDRAALESTVSAHLSTKGGYQILINNAGGPPGGPITEADPLAFLKAIELHVLASQTISKLLLPGMKEAGYGRIINIISTSVRIPIKGLGVSNTTRGAMASWAKTWSNEVGQFGITVNNVLPGYTNTERLKSLISAWSKRDNVSEEAKAKSMEANVPMARFGSPAEVAAAAAFLASPAASYITGISLTVDGGRTGAL